MSIKRLNHAVLYVTDAKLSAAFYGDVLGFETVTSMGDKALFLRADGSDNDHDLGLFSVGARAVAARSVGLYHLAWQVHTLEDLVALRARLVQAGALVGESDHGVSKSLYGKDPDGIEFEIMWAVPKADWPTDIGVRPLDLEAALQRWSAVDTADQ